MEAKTLSERDQMRRGLHAMWSSVAGGWAEHADYADARAAATTARMLELAALQPGERVLELACGPGGLGLAAAERVGPNGEVVLSDVAPEMTAIAAERAAAAGVGNVSTAVLDLEDIDQPDGLYDAVLIREGFMFALDPAQAARELARVLRPGGRAVLAVWGPRERNPWLGLVFDAVSAQTGAVIPPPGVPGPFAQSDAHRLHSLLSEAGFEHVSVSEHPVPLRTRTFDEWWSRTTALAGPMAKILAAMPAEAVDGIRDRLVETTRPYTTSHGLELPGVSLIAAASLR
ncbi:MAG TPA: methyltransferase domain-containing protein [Thermoleophilaceae bacterium]|nr:methyltransferase domain-containing protein [Thermoleophilaceae bacterium]